MSEYVKIQAATVSELTKEIDFSEDRASTLFEPQDHPVAAIKKLFAGECFIDGLRLLAHALPKREAVWWACLAVRHTLENEQGEDALALAGAEAWARQPSEPNRLQCKALAEKLKFKTAAAWAAMSAVWSTGSITDEGQPEVAPPEKLYAHAVGGAVSLAAVAVDAGQAEDNYQRYLEQGLNLAAGGNGQV